MGCENHRRESFRRTLACVLALAWFCAWAGTVRLAHGAVRPMSDGALSDITAQTSPISVDIERDTVRIFMDTYLEVYQETDRVRLGYYYKSPAELTTRKGLNPGDYVRKYIPWSVPVSYHHLFENGDPRIEWHPGDVPAHDNTPWERKRFRVVMNPWVTEDSQKIYSPWEVATEYTLHKGEDKDLSLETVYVPYVDDDNYLYKYKYKKVLDIAPSHSWVDGAQGDNNANGLFSTRPYRNRNYLDWDFSVDNLRMGISPDEPVRINGLVIRLKYDNIASADRKLTDIIVGTNDLQGDLSFDYKRATGIYSPKLPHQARQIALQTGGDGNSLAGSDLGEEFNSTPIPAIYQRDTMMSLVDQFSLSRNYKNPNGKSWVDAVPDNPLSNAQHSGFFIRIGLDRNSPHFGYQLVGGYSERIACSFQYKGESINTSLHNWWNGIEPSAATSQYPASLQKVYQNDPNVTGFSYFGQDPNYFP